MGAAMLPSMIQISDERLGQSGVPDIPRPIAATGNLLARAAAGQVIKCSNPACASPEGPWQDASGFYHRNKRDEVDGMCKTCAHCRSVDAEKKRKKRLLIRQAKVTQAGNEQLLSNVVAEMCELKKSYAEALGTIEALQALNATLLEKNAMLERENGLRMTNAALLNENERLRQST